MMQVENKISIALATHNGDAYLESQLVSFLKQTHLPDELIIFDDASTDMTVTILQRFATIAPFTVKIYVNENNLGYAQNFSKALEMCSGDIVFLSDQDDVWHADKIKMMLARFKAAPSTQLVIHDLEYCKEDLTPIGQTKIERMEGIFNLQRDYVVGMATAIRKSFLKLCLPIPNYAGVAHDSWLHDCAFAVGKKTVMREVLASYRRHSSNATFSSNLNVDFVTTPDHFKKSITSDTRLIKTKTVFDISSNLHLQWILRNKNFIIEEGYATKIEIDRFIAVLRHKIDIINRRKYICELSRLKRLIPIIDFYCIGGYASFSGWKSALKDLFLN